MADRIVVETTLRTELIDITQRVRAAVEGPGGALATVFVPHTTAGVVVQAAGAGATALTASSVSIPLADGRLALGDLQAIFLAEFDGPRQRRVLVSVT